MVEREGLVLSQNYLGLGRGHKCTDVTSLYLLPGQLGTDPEDKERREQYKSLVL